MPLTCHSRHMYLAPCRESGRGFFSIACFLKDWMAISLPFFFRLRYSSNKTLLYSPSFGLTVDPALSRPSSSAGLRVEGPPPLLPAWRTAVSPLSNIFSNHDDPGAPLNLVNPRRTR